MINHLSNKEPKDYEPSNWQILRKSSAWDMKDVDKKNTYSIRIFDDGIEKYKKYENEWCIYGYWRDKTTLMNAIDPTILIYCISIWKLNPMS